MKLTSALVVLAAMAGVEALTPCGSVATRKEIRSLSSSEWSRTASVLQQMNNYGWFAWFAYLHSNNFNVIHNCEMFFPFHRRFVRDFESVGQRFDASFAVPYWDEARDYANMAGSAVLSSSYLGGNGQSSNRCVTSGLQGSWSLGYPSAHCLQRQYNNGNSISPIYSPEYLQSILTRSTKMSQLRPAIENSLHGIVHLSIGGDMTQMYSPNDFVFWLHHANIDRLWFVWQMQNPQTNFWSLDGTVANGQAIGYGTPVTYYGDAIIDVMYPTMNNMCFTYDNVLTVTSKRKRDVKKCIPRPTANNNYGSLPPLVNGVFEDVNQVMTDAETYVKDHLVSQLPSSVLDKWFPALQTNNYTQADIPEPPVAPVESAAVVPTATGYVAPALPTDAADVAGHNYGAYFSAPEETDTTDDYETEIPITSLADDSSDEASGESSGDAALSPEDATTVYSAAVAVPTHGQDDTYNAAEADSYSVDYHAYDLSDDAGLDGVGPTYPMPVPAPFTIGFIKMHGYSIKEITQNYELAKLFVDDMNAAKYQSPYAMTAQNISNLVGGVSSAAADLVGAVSDVAGDAAGAVSDVVDGAAGAVSDVAGGAVNAVSSLF
ncbi:hypothetical protein H4217_008328 [Coemansia sp. RSA 1939]|nr:hypothetical protein H4217_008328 [Coemansia sp. RSA 1939]KAJ2601182.1 hypothetical protein EV177_007017 [Coemansia sp. RSA 1804]